MDVFNKFIVEDGCIILSKVTYHKELVTNKELVKGGGSWKFDDDYKTISFFGSSHDFGAVEPEDIQKAVTDCKVFETQYSDEDMSKDYKFVFYTECGDIFKLN